MTAAASPVGASTVASVPAPAGLPLTVVLAGRRVLVVGAGPVSARRARAFLDAGADLRIVAPQVSPEMAEVLDAAGAGAALERRAFRDDDLAGAWLVHVATGDGDVDARVAARCEERATWCVTAGDAAVGSARVPARAGVATPGGEVRIAVESADPRRSVRVGRDVARALSTGRCDLRARRRTGPGWVAVVGGGPEGDLLTVRARRLLHAADVVVAGIPLDPAVRIELDDDVEVLDPGCGADVVAERVAAGLAVVRVVDPAELPAAARSLRAAGLDVQVVPGVVTLEA